ncbi:hypothetical protein ACOME3_009487 [Neoechinorhynchus agilis]
MTTDKSYKVGHDQELRLPTPSPGVMDEPVKDGPEDISPTNGQENDIISNVNVMKHLLFRSAMPPIQANHLSIPLMSGYGQNFATSPPTYWPTTAQHNLIAATYNYLHLQPYLAHTNRSTLPFGPTILMPHVMPSNTAVLTPSTVVTDNQAGVEISGTDRLIEPQQQPHLLQCPPTHTTVFVNVNDGQNFHVEVGGQIKEVVGPATVKMSPAYTHSLPVVSPCYCAICIARLFNSPGSESRRIYQHTHDQLTPIMMPVPAGQHESFDNIEESTTADTVESGTGELLYGEDCEDLECCLTTAERRLLLREANRISCPKVMLIKEDKKMVVKFRRLRHQTPVIELLQRYNLAPIYSVGMNFAKMDYRHDHGEFDENGIFYREIYRGTSSTINIVQLYPNTVYRLRVLNGFGVPCRDGKCGSPTSALRNRQFVEYLVKGTRYAYIEVKTGIAGPKAPESVQLVSVAPNSYIIDWEEAFDNGSKVTHYELQMSSNELPNDYKRLDMTNSTTYEIKQNLDIDQLYYVRIRAFNEVGPSPFSVPLTIDLPRLFIRTPDPPVVQELADNVGVQVKWTRRESDSFFYIQLQDVEETDRFDTVYAGDQTSCTITDLKPYHAYDVRLGTSNNISMSDWSLPIRIHLGDYENDIISKWKPQNIKLVGTMLTWDKNEDEGTNLAEIEYIINICSNIESPTNFRNLGRTTKTSYSIDTGIYISWIEIRSVLIRNETEITSEADIIQIEDYMRIDCKCVDATSDGCIIAIQFPVPAANEREFQDKPCRIEVRKLRDQDDMEKAVDMSYEWSPDEQTVRISGLQQATEYVAFVFATETFPRRIRFLTGYQLEPPKEITVTEIDAISSDEPKDHPTVRALISWTDFGHNDQLLSTQLLPDHRQEYRLTSLVINSNDANEESFLYAGHLPLFNCDLEPCTEYEFRVESLIITGYHDSTRVVCSSRSKTRFRYVTSATVPDVISKVRWSKAAQPGSLEIQFGSNVRSNGSAIVAILIRLKDEDVVEKEFRIEPDTKVYNALGLEPGKTYTVEVCAINQIGQGKSISIDGAHATPMPPLAPSGLQRVGPVGVSSLKLKWFPPKVVCCSAVNYNIEVSCVNSVQQTQWRTAYCGTKCSCKVFRLQENTQYLFRALSSCKSHGRGECGEELSVWTPYSPPEVMSAPRLKLVDTSSCYVYWTQAAVMSDGGSPLASTAISQEQSLLDSIERKTTPFNQGSNCRFRYQLILTSGRETRVQITDDLEYRFKGLKPNTVYKLNLLAIRQVSTTELYSKPSASTQFMTLAPASPNPGQLGPFGIVEWLMSLTNHRISGAFAAMLFVIVASLLSCMLKYWTTTN